MTVELSGCGSVLRGPVCEVEPADRSIRLWVDLPAGTPVVLKTARGAKIEHSAREKTRGRLLTVKLPATVKQLLVTAPGRQPWKLKVRPLLEVPGLRRARKLRGKGKLKQASAALSAMDQVPEPARGRVLSLRARLKLSGGQPLAAAAELRRSMAIHRASGRVSDEVRDGLALVYILLKNGRRFSEARAVLASLSGALAHWDEGRARFAYYRGLLGRDSGDLRGALRHLRQADEGTGRLGLRRIQLNVRLVLALLLQEMGRSEEAMQMLLAVRRDLPADTHPCTRWDLLANIAWISMLIREGRSLREDPIETPEPTPLLRSTLERYRDKCPRPMYVVDAHVNLALAALQRGRPEEAARHVTAARSSGPVPNTYIVVFLLDIEGRVALARGKPALALERFARLEAKGQVSNSAEILWRAAVGRGRALEAAGREGEAVDAYRAAESWLEHQSLRVPLGSGRALFLGDRGLSVRLLVDLLVRRGQPAQAMAAARRARARTLASMYRLDRLDALSPARRRRWDEAISRYRVLRDALDREAARDWELPSDRVAVARLARQRKQKKLVLALDQAFAQLSGPTPRFGKLTRPAAGEVILTYCPSAQRGRWLGFAATRSGVTVEQIQLTSLQGPAPALSAALLAPFRASLARAGRVRILPHGQLQRVDLHGLPLDNGVLISLAPVVYSVDLPVPRTSPRPARGRRALVVADPRRDLKQARREAAVVAELLSRAARGAPRPWQVTRLTGDTATKPALRSALGRTDLFHFAGHGEAMGTAGWGSHLRLAGAAQLTIGDILALEEVPPLIVLSGCDTGRGSGRGAVGVNLAHAFLAAGAQVVVATTRTVKDDLALRLGKALYAGAAAPDWTLERSFRAAVLKIRRQQPSADWTAYRMTTN